LKIVHRTAHYSGGKFTFENVVRLQRTKHICSVVCAYEYGRPLADFSKQRPVLCLIGPTEFHQNRNLIWTILIYINKN
jgi:hypothetical protein